ncbi:hypothetical protein ACHQM5_001834 [Ranunculus cassubicifolius]
MSSDKDAPKLYSNKPKKSQLKKSTTTPAQNPVSTTMDPTPATRKPFLSRQIKFLAPTLAVAIGGYLFLRNNEKPKTEDGEVAATTPTATTTPISTPPATKTVVATVTEKPITPAPMVEPVKVREPIPEDQQRELFKWILEEKRKVRPSDREEKKRIDEEKAILKEFIRAKSIPSF